MEAKPRALLPAQPPTESADSARREFLSNVLRLSGGALVFVAGATAAEALAESASAKSEAPSAHGASGAKEPAKARAEPYRWDEHRYAYLIDTTRCIGCGSCVRACAAENGVPEGFFRTWIERYVVGLEGSHVDSPNGGKDGFGPVQVGFSATKSFFVPKMCNHCAATPCTQVCPVGASYRTRDGVVLVDQERCIGCAYCVQACPYGSRFLSPVTETAEKCTWCYHRVTKGMRPACVEVCPTGTRQFGDLKHANDPVRLAIEHDRVAVLQAHLLTEPQCYYQHLDKEVR